MQVLLITKYFGVETIILGISLGFFLNIFIAQVKAVTNVDVKKVFLAAKCEHIFIIDLEM